MSKYKIEKNIDFNKIKKQESYPFKNMDVGDSVFFPGAETTARKEYTAAKIYGRGNNKKFAGCKCEGGIRIWRTE